MSVIRIISSIPLKVISPSHYVWLQDDRLQFIYDGLCWNIKSGTDEMYTGSANRFTSLTAAVSFCAPHITQAYS